MLLNGTVFQVRNESQNRIQEKLNLGNGVVINPDGSYQTRSQNKLRLKEGECLNMDGQKFQNAYTHRKMTIQKQMDANKVRMNKKIQSKPNIKKRGKVQ
jgi:hypothetical protein